MAMGWGKPKYGTQKGNTWRIKEGDNIFRLLPPMHSLAEEGKWANYVTVHFGYAGVNAEDPSKPRARPFRCIQVKDFRTGMILEDCPECDLYEKNKKALDQREAELKTQFAAEGKNEAEIEELLDSALGPDRGWVKAHNPDRKHYINAMSADGKEFGQVTLSHRTKSKQLDPLFKKLQDEDGIDPLDLEQGVLINVKRTGRFRDATDVVSVVTKKVEVELNGKKVKVEQIELRPLTEDEANRALKECRDLTTVGGTVLTREQIKELTECDGSPEAVDAIFKKGQKEASPAPAKTASKPAAAATKPATTATPPKPATPATTPAGAKAGTNAAIQERLKKLQEKQAAEEKAKKEAEEAAARAAAEAAAAEPANDNAEGSEDDGALEMSDEEFLARFGNQAG